MAAVDACILITGANGFVGSHTVLHFEAQGARVVPVDVAPRSSMLSLLPIRTPSHLLDAVDGEALLALCRKERVTHVVHLAYPSREDTPKVLDILLRGTGNVLAAAKELGMARVVYSSSGAVYGPLRKADGKPIREDDPVAIFPASMYRSAKMLGEWLGDFHATRHGVKFSALRVSTVYGPGIWTGVGECLKQLVLGNPARVSFSRGPYDDPIHVRDVARACWVACFTEQPPFRSYNISSDKYYTNEDLGRAIRSALPHSTFELGDSGQATASHRARDVMDATRAKEELGFVVEYDLERGIAATVAWLQEHKDRLSR